MEQNYYTYIISNKNLTTFYIGVTNCLELRMQDHKLKRNPKSFSARYNLGLLLYYETCNSVNAAIEREKQWKRWRREWKLNLIREINPLFLDLSADWEI